MPWHESMTNCHHIEHKLKSKMFSEAFSFFFFFGGGGGNLGLPCPVMLSQFLCILSSS